MLKKIVCFIAIIAIILPVCYVLADTSAYVINSLEVLPAGSKNTGTYSFDSGNMEVTVDADEVLNDSYEQKVVIAARAGGIFGANKQLARKTCGAIYGRSNICMLGNVGSGKRSFQFGAYENAFKSGTETTGKIYAGFISGFTKLISYDN